MPTPFSISTSPSMVPNFSSNVTNYAIHCTNSTKTRLVTTGAGKVTVADKNYATAVNLELPLVANQSVQVNRAGKSFSIRCLPNDFPAYTSTVTGHPQANGYLVTLDHYVVAFDNRGVPVWWYKDTNATDTIDAKFINPSTIAWKDGEPYYQLRGLNGSLKSEVGSATVPLNSHDLQQLPNGNYLGIRYETRNCPAVPSQCVDLSSWGLSSKATIVDSVIVELTPQNKVVWSWSVADHINVATANVNWHGNFPDVIHMNSIQYDGDGGIVWSARHLDAVYRINMATGGITWKLGGSATPQSLKFISSKYPTNFSGQHFARLLPNGMLTVQDNGTRAKPARAVRALEIQLNLSKHSATIVQQVTDSRTPTEAFCCGSALKLPTEDWVISWGFVDYTTELTSEGKPQLAITYPGTYSYRAEVLDASVAALQTGMNAMVAPLHL